MPRLVRRSGLTLIELLIAVSIMAMVTGSLAALSHGVRLAFEYTEGHGLATQHARVVLDRMARHVEGATASERFPGFLVVPTMDGGVEYPETLVIWHPTSTASDPSGLPKFNELIIYAPSLSSPSQLLEITVPSDTRTTPDITNLSQWRTELNSIRGSSRSQEYALTSLLRTVGLAGSAGNGQSRGAVRFTTRLRPSEAEWTAYKNGTRAWASLPWMQGVFGSKTGLRQASLAIELQLMPGDVPIVANAGSRIPIPFFGAAALVYRLER
ncbi:MAG: prepilin-type N-terminal cleavage/methylation domain-containing protein [Patescibacteria group bacterium]|nr:prepilin-type N-terminal cleavage/methylation domain-containing protein [Patescibacteria group bacterium]